MFTFCCKFPFVKKNNKNRNTCLFVCFNIPFNLISLNYTMNKLFIIGSENQSYFYDNRPFTDLGFDFQIYMFYKSYFPYRWTKGPLFMQEQWPKHSVCIYLYFVKIK